MNIENSKVCYFQEGEYTMEVATEEATFLWCALIKCTRL